jgi:uncharacterized protein
VPGLPAHDGIGGTGHGRLDAARALAGGEVPDDPGVAFAGWRKALRLPNVMGLLAGRSLLYPAGGDVAAAVDTAVSLL